MIRSMELNVIGVYLGWTAVLVTAATCLSIKSFSSCMQLTSNSIKSFINKKQFRPESQEFWFNEASCVMTWSNYRLWIEKVIWEASVRQLCRVGQADLFNETTVRSGVRPLNDSTRGTTGRPKLDLASPQTVSKTRFINFGNEVVNLSRL